MGYPTNGGMTELLLAMKEKAQQDNNYLRYFTHYRIKLGNYWLGPWDTYMLNFKPVGSPEIPAYTPGDEDAIGADANLDVRRAVHIVEVEIQVPYAAPDDEGIIVGVTGKRKGITQVVADVCDFFEGHHLGLTGLEHGLSPHIEAPEGAYQEIDLENQMFIRVAVLIYKATTVPFVRTNND